MFILKIFSISEISLESDCQNLTVVVCIFRARLCPELESGEIPGLAVGVELYNLKGGEEIMKLTRPDVSLRRQEPLFNVKT